jgi:hypothetical protein
MKSTVQRALLLCLALTLVLIINPLPGWAGGGNDDGLKLVGVIPNPGPNPLVVDISYVDQRREKYYLADVSNKSVDIFDAEKSTFLGRIEGFHGPGQPSETGTGKCDTFDANGPNGVLVANNGRLWVTDYTGKNGVVKVFELEGAEPPFTTVTPSATITFDGSGGTQSAGCRADELAFDPRDHIVIVGFPEPESGATPFVAFISSDPPYNVLGTLQFHGAGGMEQPVWDRKSHRLLVNVPGVGIAVIDPKNLDEPEKIYPTGCAGTGLALGPLRHLLVACGDGPDLIMDADTGNILTTFPASEVANSDEVWFNQGDDNFYATSNFAPPGPPTLAVIDAETNTFLQGVPTDFISHSVAAFSENNHVLVPIVWIGAPFQHDACHVQFPALPAHQGCIFVYSNQSDDE